MLAWIKDLVFIVVMVLGAKEALTSWVFNELKSEATRRGHLQTELSLERFTRQMTDRKKD